MNVVLPGSELHDIGRDAPAVMGCLFQGQESKQMDVLV